MANLNYQLDARELRPLRSSGPAPIHEALPYSRNEYPTATFPPFLAPTSLSFNSDTQRRLYDPGNVILNANPGYASLEKTTNPPPFVAQQPSEHEPVSFLANQPHNTTQEQLGKIRYSKADWERHLPKILRLYHDEDMTLEDTMAVMKREEGFAPTKRAYKERIGVRKHLPAKTARWMASKIEKRRAENKPGTVFEYGGRSWDEERVQKSVRRYGETMRHGSQSLPPTPIDVKWRTPSLKSPLLDGQMMSNDNNVPSFSRWTPAPFPHSPHVNTLQLVWRGKTRADLQAIFEEAKQLQHGRYLVEAEARYREALSGFDRLITISNEETIGAAYAVAEFFAEIDKMREADEVLNWLNRKLIMEWSMPLESVIQHIEKVMNNLKTHGTIPSVVPDQSLLAPFSTETHTGQLSSPQSRENTLAPMISLTGTAWVFHKSTNPTFVDIQISSLKEKIKAGDRSIEAELSSAANYCQDQMADLSIQYLRLRKLQVKVYSLLHQDDQLELALARSRQAVKLCVNASTDLPWPLLQAAARISRKHLKLGHMDRSNDVFEYVANGIEDKVDSKGSKSGKLQAFCILVGKLVQELLHWRAARPWFERALAAMRPIQRLHTHDRYVFERLEQALEEEYYEGPIYVPCTEIHGERAALSGPTK
ncbi:hypothetical protein EV356DRAFT_534460 [Viridothelium virens]|uniref:Clr5 domain-containing protein n=1 Tax=Viridothelium virens TaxID=1048519 RepID=A0A6A6H3Y8_VIRVR|nr:hypothetical protein EV356DRAFT_534460 [Viridothelium virens]